MTQNEAGLTAKQETAITALLTEPSQEKAAKKAGVSRSSLLRWLADESFRQAYETARSESVQRILQSLQSASLEAIETLRAVMKDKLAGAPARVAAARCVLDNMLRSREALDIEERLRNLETKRETNYEIESDWTN